MSWLRLDDDYASDGTLRRCRAVAWWPLILCAMKRGGGVASDDDLSGEVLADIGQGDAVAADAAVERLKAAGMLVATAGGWTTPGWSRHQPDPTAADRQARSRARNRRVAEVAESAVAELEARNGASRAVTVTCRDVTVTHARRDGTGQDVTTVIQGDVVETTPRARAVEHPPPPSTPARDLDAVARVVGEYRKTQSGRQAMHVSPLTVEALAVMVDAHGPDIVTTAIRRAAERCRGELTIAYLRPVVAGVAMGEPEQRPTQGKSALFQNSRGSTTSTETETETARAWAETLRGEP